eukprot:5007553-Pyramimonas_sp.AAC.1
MPCGGQKYYSTPTRAVATPAGALHSTRHVTTPLGAKEKSTRLWEWQHRGEEHITFHSTRR